MAGDACSELPGKRFRYADRGCAIGLGALAILAIWFGVRVWQLGEGYWRPHELESLSELHEFTHEKLPPGTALIAAQQQFTPGENNVWAVLDMSDVAARKWLSEPPFEQPPAPKLTPDEQAWILPGPPGDWDAWRPAAAEQVLFNQGGNRFSLADLDQPGRARVYVYWLGSSTEAPKGD